MSSIKALKAASSLLDLSELLDVRFSLLCYVLYVLPKEKKELYSSFSIPKRHGGTREINSPIDSLKLIQQRLSELLQNCWAEVAEIHGHKEDENHQGISHGFKRFHTIMTNGRPHVARRYVFNVDLNDFFGSINFGRVRAFFISNKNFKLDVDVATVIAQIACYKNKLPQGSPCSPVISNFIANGMDLQLVRLARENGITYTRYADDLTFSTNLPEFPAGIAVDMGGHNWQPGPVLSAVVKRSGFSINPKKTRMQYKDSRQEVTGLTVNKKINVPATYRYMVRSMVHSLFLTGQFSFIYKKRNDAGICEIVNQVEGTRAQLFGMLSYIDQVDRFNGKLDKLAGKEIKQFHGRIKLFRQFLYYDKFYAAKKPIIICEGKTDNVYLRCAIKSLAIEFPILAKAGLNPELKVDFFKYVNRRITDITELNGGYGGLCKFLKNYHEDLQKRFRLSPRPEHPVIVFIDNDSGANKVYEVIAGITKKKRPEGKAPFIHVASNLYVVPTPFDEYGGQTDIECFFTEDILSRQLNGRTFSKKDEKDSSKYYNKATFSLQVVARGAAKIDFSNFRPLLTRITDVIEDYESKKKLIVN